MKADFGFRKDPLYPPLAELFPKRRNRRTYFGSQLPTVGGFEIQNSHISKSSDRNI